uniref:Uncharacterized protein n=1 Tax=Noccaea caerulescens TaxID=107243 RepID=A0A1J3JVX0_NOCCA
MFLARARMQEQMRKGEGGEVWNTDGGLVGIVIIYQRWSRKARTIGKKLQNIKTIRLSSAFSSYLCSVLALFKLKFCSSSFKSFTFPVLQI